MMRQRSITAPPPGWDSSISQGKPPAFHQVSLTIWRYPLMLLGGERHGESKVFFPRTPHMSRLGLHPGVQRTNHQVAASPTRQIKEAQKIVCFLFNPLHSIISIHILHTVLCTFTKVLTRRICLTIKIFSSWWSFPFFSWHLWVIQGWYCKEKLDAGLSQGLKG